MTGWKSLTHDFRPPVQGGEPIFTGQYPFTLPTVSLDTFAARSAWISQHSDILTVGIRDAYRNGLGIAAPIAGNQIGWAMA